MECYVTGIGEDFRADLFFHIDDKQLVDRNNQECNKERDARSEVPLERAQLEHGLDIARDKMCYNDTSGLELLFDDKFTLEGCQETINKTMALKYIWEMIDPKDPFEYHVSMARFEVSTIESIVTIKGIQGKEFVIELHYDPNSQILHRAKSLSCGGPGK
ncbi:hypothetical protein CAEBREN_15598 [Caenorhabditis brenneri]|uniref:NTF2-like domain-containing protein n=1 Tax=Caenorhabditis brenneri TaxID=135651 RepID=G0P5K5_CAEBE|nr:hypothetical protein CAEBREN_15598 [Caenorhabditis brenneri]